MIDSSDFEGKFEFRPLEPGYGLTVGMHLEEFYYPLWKALRLPQ